MFNEINYHEEFDIYYPLAHKVCFTGGGPGGGGWASGKGGGGGLGGGGGDPGPMIKNSFGSYPASAIGGIQNATGWASGGTVGATPASGWMIPAQAQAYRGPTNTGAGSRGVASFGSMTPNAMSWSNPSSPGNAGFSGGFSGGSYQAPSYARFDSTPFSSPTTFNNPGVSDRSTMQSNPLAQAFSGKVGGTISGPANPYNNGQFVQQAQPASVFDALQSAWNATFNTMGTKGAIGFGLVPGGKTGNVNAPGQPATNPAALSNPDSFQQHTAPMNYAINPLTGKSEPTNPANQQNPTTLVSADYQGQTPGAQLAAVIGNLTPGQALSPAVLSALQAASPNVITFAMDHANESTVLALMQKAVNTNTPLSLTNYRYQQMTPAMVTQILDNPALSKSFRTPYIDATKGIFDQVGNFLQQMGLGFRFNTARTVNLNFRVNPDATHINDRGNNPAYDSLKGQLALLGYGNSKSEDGSDYGQASFIANSVLSALDQAANGSTIIAAGTTIEAVDQGQPIGVTITSEGNNQYSISMPGPLYGALGYSAQSIMQMMATGKALMGESGDPWSGNSQNIQILEAAKRTGGTNEIGPAVKADGSFDLGIEPQTVAGIQEYFMQGPKAERSGLPTKTSPIPSDTISNYTNVLATATWPDAVKQYFIQSSVYNQIVNLWQSQAPDTPFPEWAKGFDWQGYYTANASGSTGGSNMYRPTSRSGGTRRLRSVSY